MTLNKAINNAGISLTFYQKKQARWPFPAESIPWEIWTIKINLIFSQNDEDKLKNRERLSDKLAQNIIFIIETINSNNYTPNTPQHNNLNTLFDVSYTQIQPYLYKINYQNNYDNSMSTTMKKLFKETLAL
ncbi:unnamed protein product [Gordionus sp. m RMFG-2023]